MDNTTNITAMLYLVNSTASSACEITDNRTEIELFEDHIPSVIMVSKILSPIWWTIGIIGNIMALLVWLQPKMRHSSGCYLAALAITDICFLILNIIYEIHYTYTYDLLDKPILCQWFAISFLAVQYMSPVFVLAFTVERYLSVCHPFRMVNFNQSNIKVTVLTILGLALFCISLHGVQGFFWAAQHPNINKNQCDIRTSVLASGAWTSYTWTTEMLIFAAVPITVLVLNILVIIEVRNISNLERQNMRTNSIDRRSTTLMLLGVSFYLIFTVLPVTVTFALYPRYIPSTLNRCLTDEQKRVDPDWISYFSYFSGKIVVGSIGMSHYAVNFFIYVLTGKLFRKQLYDMLVIFCCKERLLTLSKTGVYTNTRTTRMSVTSHRGSIAKGRLNKSDPCNNDAEVSNKNPGSVSSTGDLEISTMNGGHKVIKDATGTRLLSCVEETDTDMSDREDVEAQQREQLAAAL